jgi:cytosine deaminase
LYGISRVVIGENKTFLGGEAYLKSRGVEVVVVDNDECRELMERFIAEKPELWYVDYNPPRLKHRHARPNLLYLNRNEDIGVEERVYSKEGVKQS